MKINLQEREILAPRALGILDEIAEKTKPHLDYEMEPTKEHWKWLERKLRHDFDKESVI